MTREPSDIQKRGSTIHNRRYHSHLELLITCLLLCFDDSQIPHRKSINSSRFSSFQFFLLHNTTNYTFQNITHKTHTHKPLQNTPQILEVYLIFSIDPQTPQITNPVLLIPLNLTPLHKHTNTHALYSLINSNSPTTLTT